MYIEITPHKITKFLGLLAALAITLSITVAWKDNTPREYLSFTNDARILSLPLRAIRDKFSFGDQGSGRSPSRLLAAAASSLFSSTRTFAAPSSPARDIPVLLYHGINTSADRFTMTPDDFRAQMFALKREGYQTITLAQFTAFMQGKGSVPDKSFLLTFDDGRSDSYYGADPVLAAVGFHAVMFVATQDSLSPDLAGNNYYLHEGLLKLMMQSGRWEMASHAVQATGGFVPIDSGGTKGNFLSNKMWRADDGRLETDAEYKERINWEIAQAKGDLKSDLGATAVAFAYPFGDYGQGKGNYPGAKAAIREAVGNNYLFAFTQVWPGDNAFTSNTPESDPLTLRRIEPASDSTADDLLALLSRAHEKDIPYEDHFSSDEGWKGIWGGVSFASPFTEGLRLSATASTTGAFAFLDGTRDWRDYRMRAVIDWERGSDVSLIARFKGEDDYVACTFNGSGVKIDEQSNGETLTLASESFAFAGSSSQADLSIAVKGSLVECFEGEKKIVSSFLADPHLLSGGVALRAWDKSIGRALVNARSISVSTE